MNTIYSSNGSLLAPCAHCSHLVLYLMLTWGYLLHIQQILRYLAIIGCDVSAVHLLRVT